MDAQMLSGGFSDAPTQSAHAFRAVMEAMARPGQIKETSGALPPPPLAPAAGAVILTLCDTDTPLYLAGDADCDAVRKWVAFHTGAPIVPPAKASFAIGTWGALLPLSAFPIGTSAYPDRSATLIVETSVLENNGATLQGPGIKDSAALSMPDAEMLQSNHAMFPRGLDFIFTSGSRLAALPRSTEVF